VHVEGVARASALDVTGAGRVMASEGMLPVTGPVPLASNFGSTRSRGLKFGVSELEMLSEDALPLLMPLHLGAQRGQHGKIGDCHRPVPPETRSGASGRQNLPCVWLIRG
jgi:hypothetical protein